MSEWVYNPDRSRAEAAHRMAQRAMDEYEVTGEWIHYYRAMQYKEDAAAHGSYWDKIEASNMAKKFWNGEV